MTPNEFSKLLERRIGLIRSSLDSKSAEYATAQDKLHNFKRSAVIDNINPVQALRGMDLKHRTSVSDMVDAYNRGEIPHRDRVDEKIGDCINYLILLEALFWEAGTNAIAESYVNLAGR